MADAGPDGLDVRQVPDDHVAEHHVLLDDLVLLGRELAGLAQDVVGDPDLPDVMEQAGDAHGVDEVGLEAHPLGQEDAVARDIARVALRVAVLGVDREDQALVDVERARRRLRLGMLTGVPDRIAAAGLGFLEGQGRRRQELGHRRPMKRERADPGAHGQRQPLRGVELEGMVGERGPDALEDGAEHVDLLGRGQQEQLVRPISAED